MAVNIQDFSSMVKKDIFTNKGIYCGKVTDIGLDLDKFRVKSLAIDAVKGSFLANMVGNKKGVVVPFSIVDSIGDIVIIKHVSPANIQTPVEKEEKPSAEEDQPPINF